MIYFIHNARERIEHKVTNKKDGSFSFHLFTFKSIYSISPTSLFELPYVSLQVL